MPSVKSEEERKRKRKKPSYSRKRLIRYLKEGKSLNTSVTTGDASRLLGVSRVTIRAWIEDGSLKGKRDIAESSGRPSHTRIKLKSIQKLLKKTKIPLENLTKKRVTTSQLARAAGFSTLKAIQLVDNKKVKAYKLGTRRVIFLKDAISFFKKNSYNVEALRAEIKK